MDFSSDDLLDYVANPLQWSTLEQAAEWLSEQTAEEWTAIKIISFSINQCSHDDCQSSKYLRTVLPVQNITYLSPDSFPFTLSRESYFQNARRDYVHVDGQKEETTALSRNNLLELQADGSTEVSYIFANDESAELHAKRWREREADEMARRDPLYMLKGVTYDVSVLTGGFPSFACAGIPCPVRIDIEMLGINRASLKKLLHDIQKTNKPSSPVTDNFTSFRNTLGLKSLQPTSNDKVTDRVTNISDLKQREYSLDPLIERAIKDAGSTDTECVFNKLKSYALKKCDPFTGEIVARSLEYFDKSGKKKKLKKESLNKRLLRRKERLNPYNK